ncbi:COR domain-containing protein [Luteolibacter soli]|uniref:non-specific serine/threonine protein kinase n=1 Tax=Luteolibacter soli TaxID=3135280 RepID=A0ABU9ATU4_9BACT
MTPEEQAAYDKALRKIRACKRRGETELNLNGMGLTRLPPEIGKLTELTELLLNQNQLASLPSEIGGLTALTDLNLNYNRLSSLPPEFAELTELTDLHLFGNQLASLPPEIGKLSALAVFDLGKNQLASLPPELGKLTALTALSLNGNKLGALPPEIGKLAALQIFYVGNNRLTSLPPEIGRLAALTELYLSNNQLASLPPEIGELTGLTQLHLDKNPLPRELLQLATGPDRAKRLVEYFSNAAKASLAGGLEAPRRFDEAKLLIIGQGNVGKSWLLKALQGKVPEPLGETKGIEIAQEPLDLTHPADSERALRLNCWDFGGQDHYQITHQIFFSPKAIYLLVWKPRTGLDPELVSKLERIQLSAGWTAKVLIVSTHADGSIPAVVGMDVLRERFGDLIWGFHEVDSEKGPDGTGIASLKEEIAKVAAQLEGMNLPFLPSWHEARTAILETKKPVIEFREFVDKCEKAGMERTNAADLAAIMEVQGQAVYFADAADEADACLEGENLLVLKPEWLAKAVGHVIEDKPTIAKSGILDHTRLKAIWKKDAKRKCDGYPAKLHGYLLWLMWKFDIAYKRDERTSLIPQHIVRDRPDDLYWTPAARSYEPQATLFCRVPHDPPIGLIPALTAAVHPLRRVRDPEASDALDRNWRDGFFLDTEHRGAAYVELLDRNLQIIVRDKYPANLLGLVLRTLEEIRQLRWPRLEMDHRVPCCGKKEGKACTGTFRKSRLEEWRGRTVDCEECGRTDLPVDKMLQGYDPREEDLMEQLRQLKQGNQDLLATAHAIFKSLAPEIQEQGKAPNMFTILPDQGKWITRATHISLRITCWCEHPDGPHPAAGICSDEPPDYLLKMPKEWLLTVAPYLPWAATLLKAFIPMAGTVSGDLPGMDCKTALDLMGDAAKVLPTSKPKLESKVLTGRMHGGRPEEVALRHIHDALLEQVKPAKRWGDLRPVQIKGGQVLWLCAQHAAIQQPPVPTI